MQSALQAGRAVKQFSKEDIASIKLKFQPVADAYLHRDEKPYRSQTGSIIAGCPHVLDFELNQNQEWERSGLIIGGLDAHLCRLCSCWWVDSQMRWNLLTKRGSFSESIRDNGK